MRLTTLLILAAGLAACEKAPPPAAAPTAEAIGAELATLPQLLVPISTATWASMQAAAVSGNIGLATADRYPAPYAHASVRVNGRPAVVLAAYTSVWLVPAPVPLQPMSPLQYLRAFAADPAADLASVVSPKGNIFFTREQLPYVIVAAGNAGAAPGDLPYSVVLGAAKKAAPR